MEEVEARGVRIPALGLGTWQLRGEECREAVRHGLELGYRHIDTARSYENEAQVGRAIADTDVDRDELFLVTKVPSGRFDRDAVAEEVEASLRELGTDHVDLLLIHQPPEDVPVAETLEAMRQEQERGRVLHLGVSNFDVELLAEATEHADIVTNQIEYHAGMSQDDLLDAARDRDIIITAYSPLDTGGLVDDGTLADIGAAHGKSAEQVAIRWLLDQDLVATIPRSSDPAHREENLQVFDFHLTEEDHRRITELADR